jgi:chromosomal replication initiator protein
LTQEFLSIILKDFIEKEQTLKKLTIREIQECICKKYGVSIGQILSSDRTASLVSPRQLAMYISRKYTTKSLQEIAAEFDKKHATILHGVKAIEKRLDVESELKGILSEVLGEFGYNIADKME